MEKKKITKAERAIERLFRDYERNKQELENDYNFPTLFATSFDRIAVQTDKSKNRSEEIAVKYASRREELYKKVYIVDEVLRWFQLEGHGREKFIKYLLIEGNSWTATEMNCHISRCTLSWWRKEVFEKTKMVAQWFNYRLEE